MKEHWAGKSVKDRCRKYDIAPPTFYSWKRKHERMDAKQLQEYMALQEEKRKLKQMCADLSLDHWILKNIIERKAIKPCDCKALAHAIVEEEGMSVSRACVIVGLARSQFYYQSK